MNESNFTEIDLVNTIKDELVKIAEGIECKKGDTLVNPRVYKYFTPTIINKKNEDGVYPAFVVRFLNSVVDSEKQFEDMVDMRIIAVAKNDDLEMGIDEALTLVRKAKEVFQEKYFIGPFGFAGKMTVSVPEEQEYPNWQAILDFEMELPAIQTNVL